MDSAPKTVGTENKLWVDAELMPPPPPRLPKVHLRRSYAIVPGQSNEERLAMVKRLDAANAVYHVARCTNNDTAPLSSTPTRSPRSLDNHMAPGGPKRKKRKRRAIAVKKNIVGEEVWEGPHFFNKSGTIVTPEGEIILTRQLSFAEAEG